MASSYMVRTRVYILVGFQSTVMDAGRATLQVSSLKVVKEAEKTTNRGAGRKFGVRRKKKDELI